MSVRTGYALILSPILLLRFVWFQAISKNNTVYGNDVEVSSQLEDEIAVFLCGIFVAALLSLPAKRMKPKITETLTPISNRANRFFGTEPAPRSFFKGCVACGKEIPIASEECQYCGAKQDIERKGILK